MRVFLTGATGFVGSYVARRLLFEGRHEVAALIRRSSDPWRIRDVLGSLVRINGELSDLASIRPALTDFRPDVVIHLAWGGVGNQYRNDPVQVANIDSTLELVRLTRDVGARVWVGLGSQAEYGPTDGPILENAPTRPTTLYGISKLSAGLLSRHFCAEYGLRYAWLRLFSTYGPMDDPSWMIPYLINQLLRSEKPSLTLGTQLWDYVYVGDAARAIERVALTDGVSGVFNLGSGRPQTIRAIVETIREMVDPALPLGFGEVPFRPDQVMHLEAVVERLKDEVAWTPEVNLENGMRRTVAWFREYGRVGTHGH